MSRPFPWKCRNCGEREVAPAEVDYTTEMEHDGRSYCISIPMLSLLECKACHNRTIPDESFKIVLGELRSKAGLLTPEQIRQKREDLGLTQKKLATLLRVAESTVSRWETGGQMQQRAMDLLLRMFFDVKEVQKYLGGNCQDRPQELIAADVNA